MALFHKKNSGGFVFAEFAIALPLLIFLMYGLATVSLKIFQLGRNQLADYVLEEEAQRVMERIVQEARVAKEVVIVDDNTIKFVYHTITDRIENTYAEDYTAILTLVDVLETQYFITYAREGRSTPNLYAQRQNKIPPTNPITGENFFGDTKINSLKCERNEEKKILHISLEMESLVTGRKIKLNTAVFMPNFEVEED